MNSQSIKLEEGCSGDETEKSITPVLTEQGLNQGNIKKLQLFLLLSVKKKKS